MTVIMFLHDNFFLNQVCINYHTDESCMTIILCQSILNMFKYFMLSYLRIIVMRLEK